MQKEDASLVADIFQIDAASVARLKGERNRQTNLSEAAKLSINELGTNAADYRIGPQDVLRITVWNHPELNNPAQTNNSQAHGRVVGSNGTFFYPYLGEVKAVGRTVAELRAVLTKGLARYLTEPQVDVEVSEYRSQKAFVVGQVASPGVRPLTAIPTRVTDLVAMAGGLGEGADLRNVVLTRGQKSYRLDLYALYYSGDLSQNILIQNGDVLNIPENRFNKVFVLGEVGKPQSIVIPRGRYSLAEALADAGGLNQVTSNAAQVYVIRGGSNGKPQIWHINARSPEALVLADGFEVQARDVIYVDPAAVTRWSRVINQILPSAQFLRQSSSTFNVVE
ncbi:MAG: polysaccharide biosynthesis/export family protein [Pigmentiphaga sp.]|uniref:polysaccharide biosynthesis/export family protein n=1 Tax=Pigmentiphaga sp. TaxID=1977564 RepID=UPI0029B47E33|nr:polysaccharide biosynthesis/export family protein [Pigmentiphaga sp.]MDX3906783.1 polysaccharide biosynthesis/export family protein [Pigmentiphaga sp.]